MPSVDELDIVKREDGSWLIDGSVSVERFKSELEIETDLPGEEETAYNTLGGFVMNMLGRIPDVTENFMWEDLRFEVIDMDKNRIDKMLVTRMSPPPAKEPC